MADSHWKRWGRELRHHRLKAGKSQRTLADALHLAAPTISAYEVGRRAPGREQAQQADDHLGTGGVLVSLWDELVDTRDIPSDWLDFSRIEQQAAEVREYQSTIIPGILQTPEYAKGALRNTRTWTPDEVERLTKQRAARLDKTDAALTFVVDHVALRRAPGSDEVLKEQLAHLRTLVENHRIRLSVIPDQTSFHPGVPPFRIMTLPDGRVIGHEEYVSGVNVATGPQVNTLLTLFGVLQSEALDTSESARLIGL